jgi:hypothetical protein
MKMQDRLIFVLSPPRAGSTLLQRMLGSHSQIFTCPEPHLISPLAYLGYHDLVYRAPYDHINGAEAIRSFVSALPRGEMDYLDALRAYTDTMYGRMLGPSGRRYFLDKTPANALVLPFLGKLYPEAHYIVLTRHPLAVMSSYANSFFGGDWREAHAFNPVVNRYVAAVARFMRRPPQHLCRIEYERLVRDPGDELARLFAFLGLENEPQAVEYGDRFDAGAFERKAGSGDPLGVAAHGRPVQSSVESWVTELAQDDAKLELAQDIVATLAPEDVELWGYSKASLLEPVTRARQRAQLPPARRHRLNSFLLQRKIMIALKKDIDKRPHGRLLERVRYYCNVLLRE